MLKESDQIIVRLGATIAALEQLVAKQAAQIADLQAKAAAPVAETPIADVSVEAKTE